MCRSMLCVCRFWTEVLLIPVVTKKFNLIGNICFQTLVVSLISWHSRFSCYAKFFTFINTWFSVLQRHYFHRRPGSKNLSNKSISSGPPDVTLHIKIGWRKVQTDKKYPNMPVWLSKIVLDQQVYMVCQGW
jgi:hypothetical protein